MANADPIISYSGMSVIGTVKASNGTSMGVVDEMPDASALLSGASVLYLGTDGTNYRTGTVYECTGSGSSWTWTAKGTLSDVSFTSALKSKLDGISDSADAVSFTRTLASGTKIGTITINGNPTDLYCQTNTDTDTKVKQIAGTANSEYPLLMKYDTGSGEVTDSVRYNTGITVNPSAKSVTATTFKGALNGNASSATKATQDASGNVIADTYATKASLADYAKTSDISNIYRYKSSVAGVADLPTSGQAIGDAYNIESEFTYGGKKYPAGTNVAWNGTAWDPLGGTVDLSAYQTKSVGTASRALVTDTSGNIAVSAVTSTELGYLDGVTSSVQTQITNVKTTADAAMPKSGGAFTGNVSGKYFTGTWLQTTSASNKGSNTGKIAVIDSSGWIYYRTPDEIRKEMGAPAVLSAKGASVTWASDTSVSGYAYKGTIALTGCTADYMPIVAFTGVQAKSGNYSSYSESASNAVYIWSKVNTAITVDVTAVKQ